MKRSQILVTQELDEKIKSIAEKQGLSQSNVVRKLLERALAIEKSLQNKDKPLAGILEPTVYDLSNFTQTNPRVDGFKEIFSVGGKTTEVKVLPDSVFRHYLKHKNIPAELEFEILKVSDNLKELSETKKLVVRRAYVVPGLENPPGPRFLGLTTNEVVNSIREIYNFAIEHEYYKKEGSQIVCFFYPFADPKPLSLPIKQGTPLPYGGYATPLNKRGTRVEVFAVWGNNEGVQSFDAIDRYIVDTVRKIIINKDIPQKTIMLCTTTRSQSDKISVPQDKQFEQILSDSEILEVGRVVFELTKRYGLRRVEFSFDGTSSIEFNESAPYEIHDKKNLNIQKRGKIKLVSLGTDISKLVKLSPKEVEETIIYINRDVVENRAYDILNGVAGLSNKFTVLYPGLSATAHAMRVLSDFGHTAIVVGSRTFKDEEEVVIKTHDDDIVIESLSESKIKNYVINLHDAKLFGNEIVGGKAFNLSTLKSRGFNTPHGVVLSTRFFDKITKREHISISDSLWKQIEESTNWVQNKKYAVRSSANVEDHKEHSFAGQFDSFLNVEKKDLKKRIRDVFKSNYKKTVKDYFKALGLSFKAKMAVVIQDMVDADKSGVVFGKDIQTGSEDIIIIDVTKGLGQGVVEGTARTQRILYSRSKDKFINGKHKQKNILSRMEIDSLVEMAKNIEHMMGEPQDIEWAIDKTGQIWIIQTRALK